MAFDMYRQIRQTQPWLVTAGLRLARRLYYTLRWLPKQLSAVWRGENIIMINNRLGNFHARPLTDTVAETDPAYEARLHDWVTEAPEGVFIDIGASVGLYAKLAENEGSATAVWALEPNPSVYPLLVKNISANQLNAEPVHAAASQRAGSLELAPNTVHTKSSATCGGSGVTVPTVSVDDFTVEHDIDPGNIGCIKIDVDGHELPALEGMQRTLRSLQPGARVFLEVWNMADTTEKTLAFVKWCGFELADQLGNNYLFIKQ